MYGFVAYKTVVVQSLIIKFVFYYEYDILHLLQEYKAIKIVY